MYKYLGGYAVHKRYKKLLRRSFGFFFLGVGFSKTTKRDGYQARYYASHGLYKRKSLFGSARWANNNYHKRI